MNETCILQVEDDAIPVTLERAVDLISAGLNDATYVEVLQIRERMNGGGKRRHTMEKILRDYTPNSAPSRAQG